jgi:hypothetical protein
MLTFLMCFQRLAIALKIVDWEVVCLFQLNCSNLSVVTFFGHHVEIDVYHRCLFWVLAKLSLFLLLLENATQSQVTMFSIIICHKY